MPLLVRLAAWPIPIAVAVVVAAPSGGCMPGNDDAGSGGEAGSGTPLEAGSGQAPDASACRPGDVGAYQPGPYHFATAPGQGVCLPGLYGVDPVQGFYDACLGPSASADRCSAFESDPATAACARCILTPDSANDYGPLVDHAGLIAPNTAGCLELTAPGALSCSQAMQALTGCELAACEANCPVHDAASREAYDACAAQADAGACRSYATAATCAGSEPDSGPAAACLATSFLAFYQVVVPLFCGLPPARADAGALLLDASVDATASDGSVDAAAPLDAQADGPADARPDAGDAAAGDGAGADDARANGDASGD